MWVALCRHGRRIRSSETFPINSFPNIRSVFRALSLLFSAVWVGFYVLLWLLMHMSCELGFPSNCRRSYEPMDVLIELPFLLAFALGQVSHETTRSAIYSVDIACTDSVLPVVRLVCVTCAFHRFWCQPGIHRRNDARSCFLLLHCSLGTHGKTAVYVILGEC